MTRVLVVDDDEATRDVLRMMLEESHFTVLEAGDGDEAIRTLRVSADPLVVLLDLDLPGTDGLGVLRAVAADAALADRHHIIMITAVSKVRREGTRKLRDALHVEMIAKPFDIDVLLTAVSRAAEGSVAHC